MAAVRANTMQTITSKRILSDGQPFAATISAAKSKGERENRMRKTNQPEKSANWSVSKLSHNSRRELLVRESTRCQPAVVACSRANMFANDYSKSEPAGTAILGIGALTRKTHCSLKILLARVMRLVCFRFGRFFGGFFLRLEPFGVEDAGLIDALVRVRTKEIALRLQEIRWKTSRAITVVIRQRGRKRGDRYAELDSCRNDEAPFRLRSFDGSGEIPVEEKILQRRITPICLNDSVQEISRE